MVGLQLTERKYIKASQTPVGKAQAENRDISSKQKLIANGDGF